MEKIISSTMSKSPVCTLYLMPIISYPSLWPLFRI